MTKFSEEICSSCGQPRVSPLACWDIFHALSEPLEPDAATISDALACPKMLNCFKLKGHEGDCDDWPF